MIGLKKNHNTINIDNKGNEKECEESAINNVMKKSKTKKI
jgi:hypothetical protein